MKIKERKGEERKMIGRIGRIGEWRKIRREERRENGIDGEKLVVGR